MKKIEVLISTMNRHNYSFVECMNLSTDSVIINQNGTNDHNKSVINGYNALILCNDKIGLSRSRNLAIENSQAEICMIADDDIRYSDDYANIVINAYARYQEADIIAFQVERVGTLSPKKFRKTVVWENYLTCLKLSSVEITFKRKSIIDKNIRFNELMGAGSEFYVGEENIFLYESLKKGLKILYLPILIGKVDCSVSSWFEGYSVKYFNSIGAAYYNMTNKLHLFLILQYAFRKHSLYKSEMSIFRAVIEMIKGAKIYKIQSKYT